MPKISYGPIAKQRALTLLMALVDYGNDELDMEDAVLERLRSQLTLHWTTDRQLIVRTKLRYLETLTQIAAAPLTKPQLKTALHYLEHHVTLLEDNRTSRRGSEVWHFTLTLWHHRRDRDALLKTFDQIWEQRRAPAETSESTADPWQHYCQQALAHALGANSLNAGEPHMPLTLVERTPQSSRQTPDPTHIATPDLFTHIQQNNLQQLAIVGEPGAGKTTLLQQLAQQILQQSSQIPIVVPLAQLGTASLEDYILQDWLKLALGQRTVPPKMQNTLAQHIEQGRGWLLLDAVDEIEQGGSVAITRLAQQLQGWLSNGHIVVTCRLNLWDAGKNTLSHWPTYRLLGYEDYRQHIQPFIRRWFAHQPEQGKTLCQKLSLPEHKRLRNNLRNPLRLSLFCRLGSSGHLPTTQYQLYQQFVTALYDWQQDMLPTTLLEQHYINQVLSKLALASLNGAAQLNLPRVTQILSGEDLPWFERAIQLGWMTPLATGEKVYAFLHGTFRDYFAAQVIDQWQYFTTLQEECLPMVLPHWQAVILLWLGRDDIPDPEKDRFINALITFKDGCGQLFEHRAWLLAGRALGEYPDFSKADVIIDQLIQWRFNLTRTTPSVLIEAAKAALSESDTSRVTTVLIQIAQDPDQEMFNRWMAAYSLGRSYDPQNQVAIDTLEILLPQVRSDYLKMDMARHLGTLSPGHTQAIATLVEIINTNSQPMVKRKACLRLAKVDPNHPLPVATLEQLWSQHPQDKAIAEALLSLQPQHSTLSETSSGPKKTQRRLKHQRQPDKAKLIDKQLARLEQAASDRNRIRLAQKLSQLQPGHPVAVEILYQCVLSAAHDKNQLKLACEALQVAATEEQMPQLISKLRPIYEQTEAIKNQQLVYKLFWTWADTLGYPAFLRAWGSLDKAG